MTTKLIIAGLIVSAAIGLYWRHSYLITELEQERQRNELLSQHVKASEAEAKASRALLDKERRLSGAMVAESERITNVLTVEKEVVRTVRAECLDSDMPPDFIRLFNDGISHTDVEATATRNPGQAMQTAGISR